MIILLIYKKGDKRDANARILKNIGLDGTTQELVTEILTDTKERASFEGTLLEEFEIKTGESNREMTVTDVVQYSAV